jgi:hypothetical protein
VKSNIIDIAGILKHETEKAFLVDAGTDEPVWLAKLLVEHDPTDGTFAMPEWLAMEKGLI